MTRTDDRCLYSLTHSYTNNQTPQGDVKVFNLGLCKELPDKPVPASFPPKPTTTAASPSPGPLYKLTPRTGSRSYMAPEIMYGKHYNQKADVFSFSILLFEMLALKLPFEGFDAVDYWAKVFHRRNSNYRPKPGSKWPTVIKSLLEECCDGDIGNRTSFERIVSVLKADVADDIDSNRKGSVKDRTNHLLDRSAASRHDRGRWRGRWRGWWG